MVNLSSGKFKTGVRVALRFILTQHSRDELLMRRIVEYLGVGNLYKSGEAFDLRVSSFIDISEKILPFFTKYPIIGVKTQDFSDFCRVVELIKEKKHLTKNGLDQIRQIKTGMNRGR